MDIRKGLASGVFAAAVLAFAPNTASAENMNVPLLAAQCVVCHGPAGASHIQMPTIDDLSAKQIKNNLRAFRDGKRPQTIMGKISKGFSDAQIDAIAEYFGKK